MTQRIVTIIGTDGSGKTTLSDQLAADLNGMGVSARREWLGAESYLMAPVRRVLKVAWSQEKAAGAPTPDAPVSELGYGQEIGRKQRLVRRFRWLAGIYVAMILLDYRMQLRLKLWRARRADVVIADRYLFDVLVNLGLTLGWSPAEVVKFAQRQLPKFPLPQVRVFLRVAPEVSMARKDDIPDISYLRLRFSYYEAVAHAFGFVERDGTLPIAENAEWLQSHLFGTLAKPAVHYVHSNNEDVGGADRVLATLATRMSREFARVAVSLRLGSSVVDEHTKAGTPVYVGGFTRPQVSDGPRGLLRFAFAAPGTWLHFWRVFGRERPDLVHVNDLYDFLPASAARSRGIPVIYHVRMIQQRPSLQRAFARIVPAISSASVSVSSAVRDHYFGAGGSAHVIHDHADPRLLADGQDSLGDAVVPAGLAGSGRLVVMVGRVEEWKGQHVFLDAVAALPNALRSTHRFALVGGPVPGKTDYFESIQQRATDLGVLFLGSRDDVPAILRSADVSVHCSVTPDPFPGVVVESLLSGAATVAAAAGGVPEMITSGSVGLLVEPGDSVALAVALEDLLTAEEAPRGRIGGAGRARMLELLDNERIDAQFIDLYTQQVARVGAALQPAGAVHTRKQEPNHAE